MSTASKQLKFKPDYSSQNASLPHTPYYTEHRACFQCQHSIINITTDPLTQYQKHFYGIYREGWQDMQCVSETYSVAGEAQCFTLI